jgi:uncharacterized protein YyaL (SSP411 family)
MDEWLSDRERGGFYASQDADYSMDDDGDYFTWTLAEARAVLSEEEANVACLHYDINEIGEMHHNPAKNVLYVRASLEEISTRLRLPIDRVQELLHSVKQKMYAARLKRPTPVVDKTVYVGWNALCISAYLDAAKVLNLLDARRFALRSLDRILSEAWRPDEGLRHVLAYSDPEAEHRDVPGLLDDFAFTATACLDAYESTADLSYFNFALGITDVMIDRFFDPVSGGFFDTPRQSTDALGVLATPRKPIQDSPTPAGNSAAAIALLRMHAYTHDQRYREKAESTMETFAGVAGQYGIFAATYGIAGIHLSEPHAQIVIIGSDPQAMSLRQAAVAPFAFNKTVIALTENEVAPQNLPPALALTVTNLPGDVLRQSAAIVCSGLTCQPPIYDSGQLSSALRAQLSPTH